MPPHESKEPVTASAPVVQIYIDGLLIPTEHDSAEIQATMGAAAVKAFSELLADERVRINILTSVPEQTRAQLERLGFSAAAIAKLQISNVQPAPAGGWGIGKYNFIKAEIGPDPKTNKLAYEPQKFFLFDSDLDWLMKDGVVCDGRDYLRSRVTEWQRSQREFDSAIRQYKALQATDYPDWAEQLSRIKLELPPQAPAPSVAARFAPEGPELESDEEDEKQAISAPQLASSIQRKLLEPDNVNKLNFLLVGYLHAIPEFYRLLSKQENGLANVVLGQMKFINDTLWKLIAGILKEVAPNSAFTLTDAERYAILKQIFDSMLERYSTAAEFKAFFVNFYEHCELTRDSSIFQHDNVRKTLNTDHDQCVVSRGASGSLANIAPRDKPGLVELTDAEIIAAQNLDLHNSGAAVYTIKVGELFIHFGVAVASFNNRQEYILIITTPVPVEKRALIFNDISKTLEADDLKGLHIIAPIKENEAVTTMYARPGQELQAIHPKSLRFGKAQATDIALGTQSFFDNRKFAMPTTWLLSKFGVVSTSALDVVASVFQLGIIAAGIAASVSSMCARRAVKTEEPAITHTEPKLLSEFHAAGIANSFANAIAAKLTFHRPLAASSNRNTSASSYEMTPVHTPV